LTSPASFTESFTSKFSPLKNSSPKPFKAKETQESSMNRSNSRNQTANHHISKKRNPRILTINCRSIKDKTSELKTAINYTKPDIIIGTESWLKGIKSVENPTKDAIKSSEIFPSNCTAYRNDRGSLGGGVFILVNNNIIATEQVQYITKCEIEWIKIKLKDAKDLLIGAFYMPHRNINDLNEFQTSLDTITMENDKNIILAGDFNCPDIDWINMTSKIHANDKEIQKSLIEITAQAGFTQIHEEPTREKNSWIWYIHQT
jgi:hypothetical protein